MSRRICSFLLFSLIPAFLVVSAFAVLGAQEGRAAQPVKATNWSDPATWPNRKVPTAGDRVEIASGKEVILDVSPPQLNGLTIHGKLTFSDQSDLALSTEWIMVHGELQVGTEARPFTHRATITLTDTITNELRIYMGDRGIMLAGGTLNLHGNRSHTWTTLSKIAAAGSNSIEVLNADQWQVGDEIILASTDYDPRQAERRTISAITDNYIRLDRALDYMHLGGIANDAEARGEVGLLTRNIRIQASEDAARSLLGGHIMATVGSKMYVDGVELNRMGQNLEQGRYPIHWHLVGDARGQYIRNSAIHDSYNRCVTVHATLALQIENNVTYNTVGHCFVLEDGIERSNHFVRNLAIQTKCHVSAPCDLSDLAPFESTAEHVNFNTTGQDAGEILTFLANTASSYWITNPDNIYIGNVAAGSDATGFWFAFPVLPTDAFEGPDASRNPLLSRTTIRQFRGNIAHSNFAGFMQGRAIRVPRPDGRLVLGDQVAFASPAESRSAAVNSLVEDFTSYKNRTNGIWARSEMPHPMNRTARGGRELSSYDAPYWVTITIPESRDTFQSRVIPESDRLAYAGRRTLAGISFTPPGEGPPNTSVSLYMYDRYKGSDESVTLPVNPTLQEFVVEYNARHAHFHPALDFPQVRVGDVSTLRLGDRTWLKVTNWNHNPHMVQYVTIIDDRKMLVLDWLPPRDTFFKRNRAAKKWPEIENMLASVRVSKGP